MPIVRERNRGLPSGPLFAAVTLWETSSGFWKVARSPGPIEKVVAV
jgi:hypothetical protein